MPVSLLLVEGELDAQIVAAILSGRLVTTVRHGGSKDSLGPMARDRRLHDRVDAYYLRDRDFDHDPPEDVSSPVVDRQYEGKVLGWRWGRHEIENYLLEPALVARALKWSPDEFAADLVRVAQKIRFYQIARWVVGSARKTVPPRYLLHTKPAELDDDKLELPERLGQKDIEAWVREHIRRYHSNITQSLSDATVTNKLVSYSQRITDSVLQMPSNVLLWCSGKDLLAGLEPDLRAKTNQTPGGFRAVLRDWVRSNAEDAVHRLPEWSRLVELLKA